MILFGAMLHAGLTGNIASGKSVAASHFAILGARIIDADLVVHELLKRGTSTYRKVVDAFGEQILDAEGEIARRKLAEIVFPDAAKRRLLNRLTHPGVAAEISRRIAEFDRSAPHGILIVDAALMVETGGYARYDCIIVIKCPRMVQMSRLMSRDGLTEKDANDRIASQLPIEEKLKVADYVIDTSGTLEQTRQQVEFVYRKLTIRERELRGKPPA
jgi:dephospho-CoA kinase